MCQDNTGTLIWRLIRKKRTGSSSWFVAAVPGCASRAVRETACVRNRRFVCDGHQSVSVTGGCVPRTCWLFGTSYGGMEAGLETPCAYALDQARVMINVRCPQEPLHHVAEVLRLQMKTSDGASCFAPFREERMGSYSLAKTPSDHRCGKPSLARAFETLVPNWVRMPRILARLFKQECRCICTNNWMTSVIRGSTFGKKNIGSQLKGERIGVASMTNNNTCTCTARSHVTVAVRNSHRMS